VRFLVRILLSECSPVLQLRSLELLDSLIVRGDYQMVLPVLILYLADPRPLFRETAVRGLQSVANALGKSYKAKIF